MSKPSVWMTKRKNKKGISYVVRWMEPDTGKNCGKTFRRREDAEDFKSRLRREIRNQEYRVPVKISFGDWVERHLAELENSPDYDLAPKTIAGQRKALDTLGNICKPETPGSITPMMIRSFRKKRLEAGLASGTINKRIRAIRSALSYAVRAGIIPSNKLLGPHRLLLREDRRQPNILKVETAKALLDSANDPKFRAVLSLAYYHGLRRKEICYLRWEDIDFGENRLNVVHRAEARTKTKVGRSVFLRQETADLLVQLREESKGLHVFENPASFYWLVGKWLDRLVSQLGLPRCTLHDFRKTCNTLMKEKGVSLEAAMQVLGHRSAKVNQRCYTGALTKLQRAAVNSLPSIG